MTSPYTRAPFPKEENLAELYHENTKIRAYARDAGADAASSPLDLPPAASLAYADPSARIPLPPPRALDLPLTTAVFTRRTRRTYAGGALRLDEASTLLAHAYGVTGALEDGEPARAAPSAGARYPLEMYLVALDVETLEPGPWHYHPETHALERIEGAWDRAAFARSLFDAPWVRDAAAVVLVGAVFPRTLGKYRERGYRLVLLDAGHASQNLLLAAHAAGLAAAPLAGFVDDELNALVALNGIDENVLLAVSLGRA